MELLTKAMTFLKLWPVDEVAAYSYGQIQSFLRKAGKPIGQLDVLIAATVKSMEPCTLVTTDQDFFSIPNLKIVNWIA